MPARPGAVICLVAIASACGGGVAATSAGAFDCTVAANKLPLELVADGTTGWAVMALDYAAGSSTRLLTVRTLGVGSTCAPPRELITRGLRSCFLPLKPRPLPRTPCLGMSPPR